MIALLAAVTLQVSINGQNAGEITVTQHLIDGGGKRVETRNGDFVQTTSYDAKGAPVSMRTTGRTPLMVTFDKEGARVNGELVPLLKNAPRENRSEFWFLRDQPKKGEEVSVYTFGLNRRQWELTRIRFIGRDRIGNHVQHRVATHTIDAWLDERGLPIRVEDDEGLKMERKK